MKSFSMWAAFLMLVTTQTAVADYLDYTFIEDPEISLISDDGVYKDLKSICGEMKFNYLDESKRLRELKMQLDTAVLQPLTEDQLQLIENLKQGIHESSERIRFLSRPEWNTESFHYVIRWWLGEDYARKMRKITGFEVTDAYYKGEFAGYQARNLYRSSLFIDSRSVPKAKKDWQHFDFSARGTFLEICQFAPTLELEVRATFVFVDLPGLRPLSHMFYLKGRLP